MKALIFAAGLGTRLKPLTDRMPKALVPVGGNPLLAQTLQRLLGAGATEIVVNIHHFGEQIIQYLQNNPCPVPLHISDERRALLDTGGGLRQAATLFRAEPEAPILIHNVDILSNADLGGLYASSLTHDALLLVSQRETSRYLLFDDEMRLCGWTNIATGEVRTPYSQLDMSRMQRYAFAGIHCFSPRLLRLMEGRPAAFPIMDFYLSVCAQADIRGFLAPELQLLDVGKQDTLLAVEDFLRQYPTA